MGATLVDITDAGRALLAQLRQARRSRLAQLLATLSAQDETTLSLAMHVAQPLIQRLIHHATQPRIPNETATPEHLTKRATGSSDAPLSPTSR